MHKICKIIVLSLTILLVFSATVFAGDSTNISDLVEKAKELDGKTLTIKGEAIGEPLNRGSYTWVNIGDGSMALGIWMKKDDANKISIYGNSKYKGDSIKVTGKLNRACKEHGGDMDFHADKVEILKTGYRTNEVINKNRVEAAGILTVISFVLIYVYFTKIKFKR